MGSFCCETFGVDRFRTLTRSEIDARFEEFQAVHVVLSRLLASAAVAVDCCLLLRDGRARWPISIGRERRCITATRKRTSNIARRIVDSRTPGWYQLGTTWLPLPHLLMMPLVRND